MKVIIAGLLLATMLVAIAPEAAAYECTEEELAPGVTQESCSGDFDSGGTCEFGSSGSQHAWTRDSYTIQDVGQVRVYSSENCSSSTSWYLYQVEGFLHEACAFTDAGVGTCVDVYGHSFHPDGDITGARCGVTVEVGTPLGYHLSVVHTADVPESDPVCAAIVDAHNGL